MIEKEIYGYLEEKPIYKYTVSNKAMKFSCISYGAALTEICVPDKNNNATNVLLNFDKLEHYINDRKMFAGAAIGRVAGRIEKGCYNINGKSYEVEGNEGENLLHGGKSGFNSYIWESKFSEEENSITFHKKIEEAVGGFNGQLNAQITYSLNDNNDLEINFKGSSDVDTLFNPTIHSYFNLSGNLDNLLKNHLLKINADYIAETRSDNIPTGKLKEVKNTAFDFLTFKDLMTVIETLKKEEALVGIDHPFMLKAKNAATLINYETGIMLEIESDRNALIVYTLNFPCEDFEMDGKKIPKYGAVALEPQTLPDAINHEGFGDIVLPKNEVKEYSIKYHFDLVFKILDN